VTYGKAGNSTAFEKRIAELADLWSMPELATSAAVRFSPRLKRSLGRADTASGRIALAAFLADQPALCDVALCHELAHLAAFRLTGGSERPHGPTWQRLVREAGHEPTLRLPVDTGSAARAEPGQAQHFTHYCPVCHFVRTAARRMPAWRCADCVAAGLDGQLEIVPKGKPR
jgi:predicted SprT family Zn-dependent metalloprotease